MNKVLFIGMELYDISENPIMKHDLVAMFDDYFEHIKYKSILNDRFLDQNIFIVSTDHFSTIGAVDVANMKIYFGHLWSMDLSS